VGILLEPPTICSNRAKLALSERAESSTLDLCGLIVFRRTDDRLDRRDG
jgi:hypothetical protein